jgi:TRAP-type C4-dicarboxylate transport system permease small subunit
MSEPTTDDLPHRIDAPVSGASIVDRLSEAVCSLFLLATIGLIFTEVIARNVFHTSLQISDEVVGYLLVTITFLSMPVAEAHGAFHRVELLQMRLSRRGQLISQTVFDLLSLAASVAVTWQLTRLAMNSWRSGDVAATLLQTPLWLPQSAMGLGMALLCLALLRSIKVKLALLRMGGAA